MGISRRTWERLRDKARDANSSAAFFLLKGDDSFASCPRLPSRAATLMRADDANSSAVSRPFQAVPRSADYDPVAAARDRIAARQKAKHFLGLIERQQIEVRRWRQNLDVAICHQRVSLWKRSNMLRRSSVPAISPLLMIAVHETNDLETVDAFDDLDEALNDLKIAIGQANHAPLAATGPESA